MNFRKQPKPSYQFSDTRSPVPESKGAQQNYRRMIQMQHLHSEFEDLKQKIKDVESKNQKVIDKIYKNHNYRRKTVHNEEFLGSRNYSPVIHYEQYNDVKFLEVTSGDSKSSKSDNKKKQQQLQIKVSEQPQLTTKLPRNQKILSNYEQTKMTPFDLSGEVSQPIYHQHRRQTEYYQTPQPLNSHLSTLNINEKKKLIEEFLQEKQLLQQELSQKSTEILKLKSGIKKNNLNIKTMLEAYLQQFYQKVCLKNLLDIEKAIKKNEQKIKNIKKDAIMLKDKQQQTKLTRLLQYGKQRRTTTKTYRETSPLNTSRSAIGGASREGQLEENKSKNRIDNEQNKKQFQQIANRYEQIIKSNNQEIQKINNKYRVKQRQCYEMKMKVDLLQKKLAEEEKRYGRDRNLDDGDNFGVKSSFSETDLLQFDHVKQNNANGLEEEVLKLQAKIQELTTNYNEKTEKIVNLQNLLLAAENKNKTIANEYKEYAERSTKKYLEEQEKCKKQFETIIGQKNSEISECKNSLMAAEKKFLERQSEVYSLQSRMKKADGLIASKDKKIEELQKIMSDNCPADRSAMMNSIMLSADNNSEAIKKLKAEIEELEDKLEKGRNEVFELQKKNNSYKSKTDELSRANAEIEKQMQTLRMENEQLKINANLCSIEPAVKNVEQVCQKSDVSNGWAATDENRRKLNVELEALSQKNSELVREKQQWYDKYQRMKSQSVEKQSESIKIKSQLTFAEKQLADSESMVSQLTSQNENLKEENKQLLNKVSHLEQQFASERQQLLTQLLTIQKKFCQYKDDVQLSKTRGIQLQKSDQYSVITQNQKYKIDYINTQNQYLIVQLNETKNQLETQRIIEQKIIDEYKTNIDMYKIDLRNKNEEIKTLNQQIDQQITKIINLTIRLEAASKNDSPNNTTSKQLEKLLERIDELQSDLKQTKEINTKLTEMQNQLFDQIKTKQHQRVQLQQQLLQKQSKLHQLQQLIQLQTPQNPNIYLSHISHSSHKKDACTLRYSSHSQLLRKSLIPNSSNKSVTHQEDRMVEFQLSEAGSEFYQQPSQISNISELFQKEEFPHERIKAKRQQQIKLFEKTSTYIKSLKKAVQEKNKKIKLLEKKIQSLKNSELVRKELAIDIDMKEGEVGGNSNLQPDDAFRDYESVQLQYRKGGQLRRYKQLQNDTKLVMQQNNMLSQQISTLGQQLLKVQQQESSLVKIKDLYKQEIKKLIKKNEELTKNCQEERKRGEQNQGVHQSKAIKQLYGKLVSAAELLFGEDNLSDKKKENQKNQFLQCIKATSSILKLDKNSEAALQSTHK